MNLILFWLCLSEQNGDMIVLYWFFKWLWALEEPLCHFYFLGSLKGRKIGKKAKQEILETHICVISYGLCTFCLRWVWKCNFYKFIWVELWIKFCDQLSSLLHRIQSEFAWNDLMWCLNTCEKLVRFLQFWVQDP